MLQVVLKSALLTLAIVGVGCLVSLGVSSTLGEGNGAFPLKMNAAIIAITAFPFAVAALRQEARLRGRYDHLREAHVALTQEAARDDLTGLLSRVAFFDEMAAARSNRKRGALLIVDADHFKSINDRYGHPVGDRALSLLSTAIAGAVRERDVVGRIGGEEFAVYLPQTGLAEAAEIGERIRSNVGMVAFEPIEGTRHPLSVSIGVARAHHSLSRSVLFAAADACLYEAKQKGRNRVVCQEPEAPANVTFLHERRSKVS